ncbi:MAG: hypothetical protein HQK56_15405 [Deltaproteobacteria bacterium]|nr:hypothetical protein [Deltaproteobacteria bacterium]
MNVHIHSDKSPILTKQDLSKVKLGTVVRSINTNAYFLVVRGSITNSSFSLVNINSFLSVKDTDLDDSCRFEVSSIDTIFLFSSRDINNSDLILLKEIMNSPNISPPLKQPFFKSKGGLGGPGGGGFKPYSSPEGNGD